MPASEVSEVRRLLEGESGVDMETQVVADIVSVKVSVDDGIDNVQAIPCGHDDAIQLEVAAV